MDDIQKRLSSTPSGEQTKYLGGVINEIHQFKRNVQSVARENNLNTKLVSKIQGFESKLSKRVENVLKGLNDQIDKFVTSVGPQTKFKDVANFKEYVESIQHLSVTQKKAAQSDSSILHFFEAGSRKIHFIDLVNHKSVGVPIWEQNEIESSTLIPVYHASCAISKTQVLLCGGMDPINFENISKATYIYDFETNQLIRKADMIDARDGHSVCHVRGKVYAFGGINKSGVLKKCEVYDIASNTWTAINDMENPTSQPDVCRFGSKYIYKIGGYLNKKDLNTSIERYSIAENRWTTVLSLKAGASLIQPLSGSIQINASQILIFGGSNTNKSFVLNVDPNPNGSVTEYVGSIGERDLPKADGFWDSNGTIVNNKVYYLQNITTKEGTLTAQKSLLSYDGAKWSTI